MTLYRETYPPVENGDEPDEDHYGAYTIVQELKEKGYLVAVLPCQRHGRYDPHARREMQGGTAVEVSCLDALTEEEK